MNLVEHLKQQRYPGRFIVIGKTDGGVLGIYGATGRHPSSLARKYKQWRSGVYAVAINDLVKNEGNPDLLEYRALKAAKDEIVISNGKQGAMVSGDGVNSLSHDLRRMSYEPDAHKTPRITGLVEVRNNKINAALHIARARFDGTVSREAWNVPLEVGKASYIATYDGKDIRPTPSFFGNPLVVEMNFKSAQEAAQKVYDALQPQTGEADYRVGVVAVTLDEDGTRNVTVINRN